MPRYIDRDLLEHLPLNAVPIADVVEVIRCQDCKYYTEREISETEVELYCKWFESRHTMPNDFCSHAEKRTARYIDANAIPWIGEKDQIFGRDTVYVEKRKVDAIPAADVRENTHGKWIDTHDEDEWYGGVYICSVCHCSMIGDDCNFCPHCGADMRGENDDE